MRTKTPIEGSMLCIDLGDGISSFARVLPDFQIAIYDKHFPEKNFSLSDIYGGKVICVIFVYKSALINEKWLVVDFKPLENYFLKPFEYYMKDVFTGLFSIYRSSDGDIRESTYEECKDLEATAVWEAEHVEDRIRDHFAGRPNVWVDQLRAKP